MVRKYVAWSRQEWVRLSDLTWAIKKNYPGKKLPKLIRMALQQFPPDRVRKVNEDILYRVKSGLAYRDQQESMGADRAVPPTINNAIDTKPLVVKQEQFKELLIPCDIGKTDTGTLIVELLKRADAYLSGKGSALTDALTSIAESLSRNTTAPVKVERPAYAPPPVKEVKEAAKSEPKKEKTKVILVGGLSIQQQEVASRICDIAKLRFIDKNRTADLALNTKEGDIIAIMTSFVDHSLVHSIKAQANGARVLELRGNASGVARDLRTCILNPEARPCTHS
jgi:hypothetical protein